jgi:outer membrane protein assembly factor BamB/orotate phosphoribosyltransferase
MLTVETRTPAPATATPGRDIGQDALEPLRRAILERVMRLDSTMVFNFKDLLSQASLARAAGRALWARIRHFEPEVLVGPGFGGVPLLYATAMAALEQDGVDLALWLVRDQRKAHAGKPWISGPRFAHTPRAVMLDDFLGRGSAVELVDLATAHEKMPLDLRAIAVLYDSWRWDGSRQLHVSRCPVVSVFRRHDLGLTRDCHDAAPPLMKGAAPPLVTQPLWSRLDFNGASERARKSSPVIADGALFAADDRSRVWRLDPLTGEAAWCRASQESHDKGIVQRLQHVDASLVYGCYDGTVTRLDAERGDVLWRWKIDRHVHATPEVDLARRCLFVNTEALQDGRPAGRLVAMDWDSGRVLWTFDHAFWAPGTARFDATRNRVLATCNDQSLVCVDADTGLLAWRSSTKGLVRGQPAIVGDALVACSENGWLQAFDLETGAELRSRRCGGGGRIHQFTHSANGMVYVVDDNDHLAVFDATDFRLVWVSTLRSPGTWAPVPFGRFLVVLSAKGHLAVFDDIARRKLWEGRVAGAYAQPPAAGIVDGVALLACASHRDGLGVYRIHDHYRDHFRP